MPSSLRTRGEPTISMVSPLGVMAGEVGEEEIGEGREGDGER